MARCIVIKKHVEHVPDFGPVMYEAGATVQAEPSAYRLDLEAGEFDENVYEQMLNAVERYDSGNPERSLSGALAKLGDDLPRVIASQASSAEAKLKQWETLQAAALQNRHGWPGGIRPAVSPSGESSRLGAGHNTGGVFVGKTLSGPGKPAA